jgi:hypothetical protein
LPVPRFPNHPPIKGEWIMKKLNKLGLKKVTLKDLDEPKLEGVAGAIPLSYTTGCVHCITGPTCAGPSCLIKC